MEYNIFAKLIFRFLSMGLIFWIIFSHGTLVQIIIALVFSEGIRTLINYAFFRKFVRPQFDIDLKLWKYLMKECFPIALSSVIWIIYFRIDMVMLSTMKGDFSVGIYSAAYTISEPLSLIAGAIVLSLFPIMSASFISSKEKLMKIYRLSFKHILIITLPIAIGTTLLADKIILLIYGAKFAESATSLIILIWTLVFASENFILTNLLISINKQIFNTVSITLCAITNILLNFILIPTLDYNGAAIATLAVNVIFFLLNLYFISRYLQILPVHKIITKPAICGLSMGVFIHFFISLNIYLLIPLAAVVYLVALIVSKSFSTEDWDIIKKVLKFV